MKLIKILIISFCIIMLLSQNSFALDDTVSTADNFINTGKAHAGVGLNTTTLKEVSGKLYNLLLTIATIIAVIVGALLGLKYMMAGIDEKVDVKQSLIPYFVSCVVVFGSLGIWKLVVTIMGQID